MLINFLEAASGAALCKTHEADSNGVITTHPYPLVKKFTSHEENVNTTQELYLALTKHAALGHCALKGTLTDSLVAEERRGKTNSTQHTNWLCLDLDFDSGFADIDDFIRCLGPTFNGVSYVFQHSNSAGIKGKAGLRGHLYFRLATPCSPGALKEWLKEVNLNTPALSAQLALAKNGHSLIWPLDISTCQNDKLIYISPPTLINLSATITQYFTLTGGIDDSSTFTPAPNPAKNKADIQKKIDELRKQVGLKTVVSKYKAFGVDQVLINPDPMLIADTRDDGDYIRCNIVGDNPSWGYYYEKDQPDILRNFKGHPLVKLRDIDPGYFQGISVQKAQTQGARKIIPLVFRDLETDQYYNGHYDSAEQTVKISATSSIQRLHDFCENNDAIPPESIPDWEYKFDPTTLAVCDISRQWANKFSPTDYLRQTIADPLAVVPPIAERVIRSICVDQPTYDHFINWLAYVFQTRKKSGTAWLFNGIEGTGKGILASKILQPIFGDRYVVQITGENLEDQFNAAWEECIFLFIDEFNLHSGSTLDKTYNRLKNVITEDRVAIRGMRRDIATVRSYINLIMATNAGTALPLSPTDRRFSIAPAQNTRLEITPLEILQLETELPELCNFLEAYQADAVLAGTVLDNKARRDLINRSSNSLDLFFRAVREGDLEYFLQYVDNSSAFDMGEEEYKGIIQNWAQTGTTFASSHELLKVFNHIMDNRVSKGKFGRMCAHENLEPKTTRVGGIKTRGYETSFPQVDTDQYFKGTTISEKVTKIK